MEEWGTLCCKYLVLYDDILSLQGGESQQSVKLVHFKRLYQMKNEDSQMRHKGDWCKEGMPMKFWVTLPNCYLSTLKEMPVERICLPRQSFSPWANNVRKERLQISMQVDPNGCNYFLVPKLLNLTHIQGPSQLLPLTHPLYLAGSAFHYVQ